MLGSPDVAYIISFQMPNDEADDLGLDPWEAASLAPTVNAVPEQPNPQP